RVPPGAPASGAQLSLKLAIPEAILSRVKTTTLTAAIAQKPVGSADYTTPGEYVFKADVPSSLLSSEAVTVDFTLSKYLPGGSTESRDLGVIVSSVSLDAK
ncbi:MAG TPA: hypothetical protein VEQ63_12185, partial [Bryobacteraceae bacterium]|nr:hypothetical protein [Bryobacteraceae bacterium]